jgi:hypothetical protein
LGTERISRITGLKNLSSAEPESAVAIRIAEIGAGAEAAARAGQQHGAHRGVGGERLPAILELSDHLARHGVELVGRIQRQRGQALVVDDGDGVVAHGLSVH